MRRILPRKNKNLPIEGVLNLYSETGTEGGYWAIQDKRMISKNTHFFVCQKCGLYWNKKKFPKNPPEDKYSITKIILPGVNRKKTCPTDKHTFELYPEETWSREGLCILKDNDQLKIYDKSNPENIVWDGVIKLKKHPLFKEHAGGLWIHSDQENIEREVWAKWFLEKYPAQLIRKK